VSDPTRPPFPASTDRATSEPTPLLESLPAPPRAERPDTRVPVHDDADPTRTTVAEHLAKADRRPSDTIWRANPRQQGLIGLTDAIGWFGANGYGVLLPLIDAQPYDLVVDGEEGLQRVQVKTTTVRTRYGIFVVSLTTSGGNQSFHTRKPFDPSDADLLYVLTDDGSRYLIPATSIRSRTALNLGARVARFEVR
jgi:hypothetical protein